MFQVTYVKNGKTIFHAYTPKTKEEALGVGHELTRDKVADFFKVEPYSACGFGCRGATELVSDPDSWGDDWPRCPCCGAG